MSFTNQSIEEFLSEHKIVYKPTKILHKDMKGFAYYKNNTYLVIVNKKYIRYQMELYGDIIDILRNNFIFDNDDKNLHYKNINKMIKNLEDLMKNDS